MGNYLDSKTVVDNRRLTKLSEPFNSPVAVALDQEGTHLYYFSDDGVNTSLLRREIISGTELLVSNDGQSDYPGFSTTFQRGFFGASGNYIYICTALDEVSTYIIDPDATFGTKVTFVNTVKVQSCLKNLYFLNEDILFYINEEDYGVNGTGVQYGTLTTGNIVTVVEPVEDEEVDTDVKLIENTGLADLESILYEELGSTELITYETDLNSDQALNENVAGYSITNIRSMKSVLDPLFVRFSLVANEADYQINFITRGTQSPVTTITQSDLKAHELGQSTPEEFLQTFPREYAIPSRVEIAYKDYNKEYEQNIQYIENLASSSNSIESFSTPIVLDKNQAAQIADIVMEQKKLSSRGSLSIVTHWGFSHLEVTDYVTIQTSKGNFEIEIQEIDKGKPGLVKIKGTLTDNTIYDSNAVGETGKKLRSSFRKIPQTEPLVLDIPALRNADNDFGYYYTAYPVNNQAEWNGAVVLRSTDNSSYDQIGTLGTLTPVGRATDVLSDTMLTTVFDSSDTLNIEVVNGTFESVTELEVREDRANVFAYGKDGRWEIIKAQTLTLEGDGTYTLSKFIRGYLGTEHAMSFHQEGDLLVDISFLNIRRLALDKNNYNFSNFLKAATFGRNSVNTLPLGHQPQAISQKPFAPTKIKKYKKANGDFEITWQRRARFDWDWQNNSSTPLDFVTEKYKIRIAKDNQVIRTIDVQDVTSYIYTNADQVTDFGSSQSNINFLVNQVNDNFGTGYSTLHLQKYKDAVLRKAPVAYYEMNEVSGNLVDSSGNNNTATLTAGTPTYRGSGVNLKYDNYSISSAGGVKFNTGFRVISDFTVSFLIYFTTPSPSNNQVITVQDDRVGGRNWSIQRTTNNEIRFHIWNSGDNEVKTDSLAINEWHYITAVRTKSTGVMDIYVNGAISNSFTSTTAGLDIDGSTIARLMYTLEGSQFDFKGSLDQLTFYNKTLTSDEIIDQFYSIYELRTQKQDIYIS